MVPQEVPLAQTPRASPLRTDRVPRSRRGLPDRPPHRPAGVPVRRASLIGYVTASTTGCPLRHSGVVAGHAEDRCTGSPGAHRHPGSVLEVFEQSEHFPHMDEPLRFTRVLRQFLEATEPSSIERALLPNPRPPDTIPLTTIVRLSKDQLADLTPTATN